MNATHLHFLRFLRLAKRLTLEELGRQLGVSGSFLSRVERGYSKLSPELQVSYETILRKEEDGIIQSMLNLLREKSGMSDSDEGTGNQKNDSVS